MQDACVFELRFRDEVRMCLALLALKDAFETPWKDLNVYQVFLFGGDAKGRYKLVKLVILHPVVKLLDVSFEL